MTTSRRRPPGRQRGFALADFVAGMLIFSGAMAAFAALTRDKFDLLRAGDSRLRALGAAEAVVDRVRLEGLPAAPAGVADADGFRLVQRFDPTGAPSGATGHLEARALRVAQGAEAHGLYEVRVTVRWRDVRGSDRLWLSTVAPLPEEGR